MLFHNAKNTKVFLYRKTNLQQNKLSPQKLVLIQGNNSFQAIIPLDFGRLSKLINNFETLQKIIYNFLGSLNPEAQLLFEALNTVQRPIEK